jgi:3-deoxy-D-manno-octulosonic-acid transferase
VTGAVFLLYQVAAGIAVGLGSVYLVLFRLNEIRERLGGRRGRGPGKVTWVHAASLGEFEAAWPVIQAAGWADHPERLLVSCTNASARARLGQRLPAGARARIAPLDFWPCVDHALASEEPVALLFFETEIWPAWILAAARRKIPIAIVSARLSDRSFPRYRALKRSLRDLLSHVSAIGCRSEEDRRRWIEIGAPAERCHPWGNTKYDAGEPPVHRPHDPSDRFVFVAGSVRPGEEGVLDVAAAIPRDGIRLVIAPRHLAAVPRWEEACFRRGLDCRRTGIAGLDVQSEFTGGQRALRDAGRSLPTVLIVDQIGHLRAFYRVADAAFVGGTWVPIGGHNLFEPAREGIPVFFGPAISGVRDAAEALLATGGGMQVDDPQALSLAVQHLRADAEERRRMGRHARLAAESLAGGVGRTVEGLKAAGFLGSKP